MSRSSPALWPPWRMAISMPDPWPRSISSVISSISSPSSAVSRSSSSWMRGSSGPSAFLSPAPRACRSRKYRSNSRSKVGKSRDSFTSVLASAALKVSRSSRPISPEAARASMASLGEMRISARLRSPMNSRIRWSKVLPGEGHPGGLEDVLTGVAADRVEPSVLEADETVEGALGDQVGHLELPAQRTRRDVLIALDRARDIGDIPHEMEHPHRPLGAAQAEDDLVAQSLAHGLHRHLPRVEQVRDRLGHGDAEEVAGCRVDVVEVPGTAGPDPELRVLPQRGRDAPAALDEHGARVAQLPQAEPRTREPQLPKLAQLLPIHGAGSA